MNFTQLAITGNNRGTFVTYDPSMTGDLGIGTVKPQLNQNNIFRSTVSLKDINQTSDILTHCELSPIDKVGKYNRMQYPFNTVINYSFEMFIPQKFLTNYDKIPVMLCQFFYGSGLQIADYNDGKGARLFFVNNPYTPAPEINLKRIINKWVKCDFRCNWSEDPTTAFIHLVITDTKTSEQLMSAKWNKSKVRSTYPDKKGVYGPELRVGIYKWGWKVDTYQKYKQPPQENPIDDPNVVFYRNISVSY